MRPELREEMLRILDELSEGKAERIALAFGKQSLLTIEAIDLLEESGALQEIAAKQYKITVQGYDYRKKLKAPWRYWLGKNWFPVAVLVVSSLVTVVASLIVVLLG